MASEIEKFESDCTSAGVSPSAAFKAGGLNPSTWFRWQAGKVSPTLRSLDAARRGLAIVRDHGAAPVVDSGNMTATANDGAEKADANISRTGVAA